MRFVSFHDAVVGKSLQPCPDPGKGAARDRDQWPDNPRREDEEGATHPSRFALLPLPGGLTTSVPSRVGRENPRAPEWAEDAGCPGVSSSWCGYEYRDVLNGD